MKTKRKTSPVRRFLCSRLFLIVSIPAVILVTLGFVRSYYNGYKINQEIAALHAEIESLGYKRLE
jgi:cell division protein FtsL